MDGVHGAVANYVNSMTELQTTIDNFQKTILAEVHRLVEYQSNWVPDGDSLHAHNGPRYAPDDPTLPQPWKRLIDGSSGSIYYWNTETNVTQYEKPKTASFLPTARYHCVSAPPFPDTNYHHNFSLTHPSHQIPPFTTSTHPTHSAYGYLYPSSYLADQLYPCDPYPNTPHSFPCPSVNYPESHMLDNNAMPSNGLTPSPSSGAFIACGGFNMEKMDHSKASKLKLQLIRAHYNLKPRSPVPMKRKHQSTPSHRRSSQLSEGLKWGKWGVCCKAPSIVPTTRDLVLPSAMLLYSTSPLMVLDVIVRKDFKSPPCTDVGSMFTLGLKKIVTGIEGFAKFSEGNCSNPSTDPSCQPHSLIDESLTDLGNMPEEKEQSAIVHHFRNLVIDADNFSKVPNLFSGLKPIWLSMHFVESPVCLEVSTPIVHHFCNLVVDVDNLSKVTNLLSGLKPIWLSMHFVDSPVCLRVSILVSYEHGSKHEAVAFDKFMVCSFTVIELIATLRVAHLAHLQATLSDWKVREKNVLSSSNGGFDYDRHLENLVDSLTRNSQIFFIQVNGRRIESKCSVLHHWLPSSLNWNKKCISDAFLSLELFVSSVTSKSLLSDSCRGGSMFMGKAMEETLLENTALQIVIATNYANSKQLSYPMHLVKELTTETVGRTISTAVDLQLFKAIIVHALQLGLSFWIVMLHFIAILKKLLVIGIYSNGLITVSVEDFSNKKFLICCLLTTAKSRPFFGQFRSLQKNKLDERLNLCSPCISRMELWHMDISCIINTSGKQLENSPFCELLKRHYGVFCLVILTEAYPTTFLLYFEDNISQNWSNMSSEIGACTISEMPQCMNRMQSFPLDGTSWQLVVIKHVTAILQVNIFYYYVQWAVPLVIIHFGSKFFPSLCACVVHSSTDIANPTIIIRGAKDDNLLHCNMAAGTLGHLNLHGHLEFKDEEVVPNALDVLTSLLHHDTRIYVGYLLDIPEITVAWQNSKFHLVVYINVSTSILAENLENIRTTLVSANSTTSLRHTTSWDVKLMLHDPCFKVSLLSLFEMVPQQFYEATLAEKVILDQATLHNVEYAFLCFTKMELFWSVKLFFEHIGTNAGSRTCKWNWFGDKVGVTIILDMALFAHRPTLELRLRGCSDIFGGLHVDNNFAILPECLPFYIGAFCFNATVIMRIGQLPSKAHTHCDLALFFGEGPEQYLIRSFVLDDTAPMLLVVNPGDVVVRKGTLTLSSYKLLICAIVMKAKIVVVPAKMNELRGKLIVNALITINMLPTGSCEYWDVKVAFGFHDGMLNEVVKSPENFINEESSNVLFTLRLLSCI